MRVNRQKEKGWEFPRENLSPFPLEKIRKTVAMLRSFLFVLIKIDTVPVRH